MKLTVIKLALLVSLALIPLSSAIEFTLTYPGEVILDEPFSVTINSDSQETHDAKIFVNSDVKTDSEIYDGKEWQSPHYYLKEVFPGQKEFLLISHFLGTTQICARLRKAGGNSFVEKCGEIRIVEGDSQEQGEEEEEDEQEDEEESEPNEESNKENNLVENKTQVKESPDEPEQQSEKIFLNAPQEPKTEGTEVYKTKKEKTRLGIIYSFIVLTVIIIILLALRKL